MKFKRLLAVVAVVIMMFCLFACTDGQGSGTTENPANTSSANVSTPPATQSTDDAAAFDGYTVTVVDEGGNPIAGAFVQLCLESCYPSVTDASGTAKFDLEEAEYKVSFVSLPAGYEYATEEQEFHFAADSKEITITLKAVV